MTIRYTATSRGGTWTEVGDRIAPGQPPMRFFEMHLTRVADTSWPTGDGPETALGSSSVVGRSPLRPVAAAQPGRL